MKSIYSLTLIIIFAILSTLVLVDEINLDVFIGVGVLWLFVYLVVAGGVDSIIELTAGKLSIKRSVKEAKEANLDTQRIREEIRGITKANVENAWILASTSMLAAGGDRKAGKRLEKNLDELSKFVEPEKSKEDKWWEDLRDLFSHRIEKKK